MICRLAGLENTYLMFLKCANFHYPSSYRFRDIRTLVVFRLILFWSVKCTVMQNKLDCMLIFLHLNQLSENK